MSFNPQTFGLAVAKCPKNKKQTGGQRRAQANALPQSLLAFSWDESCSQALVWGVADVSAVSLLADRAEHIGIEQQRAEWRSTSYIVWDVANSTALDAPVHLGRESLLRAKSVEHLRTSPELTQILVQLRRESVKKAIKLPKAVADKLVRAASDSLGCRCVRPNNMTQHAQVKLDSDLSMMDTTDYRCNLCFWYRNWLLLHHPHSCC